MPPIVRTPTPRRIWRALTRAWIAPAVIALAACGPGASSASPGNGPSGDATLAAAATGVCAAVQALPDATAAQRAFENQAHEALHALAAAPGVDRSRAARLLEAMERVEGDFESDSAPSLPADLSALQSATGDALRSMDRAVPPCG